MRGDDPFRRPPHRLRTKKVVCLKKKEDTGRRLSTAKVSAWFARLSAVAEEEKTVVRAPHTRTLRKGTIPIRGHEHGAASRAKAANTIPGRWAICWATRQRPI